MLPKTIHYLGHLLSAGTIAADHSKLDKIREWPFPTTGRDMASFLGLCSYYRKLIAHFADLSDILYKVSRESKIEATIELEEKFAQLKQELCDSIALRLPDPAKSFILETDASLIAVGAVLKQSNEDGEYPTTFYSRALTISQRNYSTYERELFAVVKACESFRVFLLGNQFRLRTDHKALASIFNSTMSTSSRVTKWLLALQPYTFTIEVIRGTANVVADSLSRIPWPVTMASTDEAHELYVDDTSDSSDDDPISLAMVAVEDIKKAQGDDPAVQQIKQWVESKIKPSKDMLAKCSPYIRTLIQYFDQLQIFDDLLVLNEGTEEAKRIVVPTKLVESLIDEAHQGPGAAHEGVQKVFYRLIKSYYWPAMKKDIQLQLAACPICDKFKNMSRKQRAELQPIPTTDRGDILAIDVFGGKASLPLTARNNKYVLTMVDIFTKFGVAAPMGDQTAQTVCDTLLARWILLFGAPRRLLTDQGQNFESSTLANLCNLWRIDKIRTTSYHPAGNGACERLNQTIKHGLQKILNDQNMDNWDLILNDVMFAYNTSIHSTTGFTPQMLMFGGEARIPSEIIVGRSEKDQSPASFAFTRCKTLIKAYNVARESSMAVQRRSKDYYDAGGINKIFQVGDQVRIRLMALSKVASKLKSKWSSIYTITKLNGVVATLSDRDTGHTTTVHVVD